MSNTKFISLNNITVRVRDKFLFAGTSLQLQKADNLLVIGANGSGKTTFVKAIAGLLPVAQGEIILEFLKDPLPYPPVHKNKIAYVSFDAHKKIYLENEWKKDLSEFTGKNIRTLNLSTGQTRKFIIQKALEKKPSVLILDEPFDGLDAINRTMLKKTINNLSKKIFLILVTHRADEVMNGIKKGVLIEDGEIVKTGTIEEVLDQYKLFNSKQDGKKESLDFKQKIFRQPGNSKETLIDLKNVSVEFGGEKILEDINWQVKEGENWAIIGPNGSGKSTLVKLLTGENLQVFSNKIRIFGKSRDELSIDELNKKISVVSTDLNLRLNENLPVLKIVGQNNFWILQKLGISGLAPRKYGELSFGQTRLVIIARALSKNPAILILDEPCHGLDTKNRIKVLSEIELIAKGGTTVILITHHKDEIIPSITSVMHLKSGKIEKITKIS